MRTTDGEVGKAFRIPQTDQHILLTQNQYVGNEKVTHFRNRMIGPTFILPILISKTLIMAFIENRTFVLV